MGLKNTRAKGNRIEREIVKELNSAGIGARRVGMSGQLSGQKGDVLAIIPAAKEKYFDDYFFQLEVKAKNKLPKWMVETLDKDKNDAVIYREDKTKRTLVVLDFKLFKEFLK